ncbi:MAG TPA: 23S rRNA (pseudouridine(1915)-N(3))-methyltransferase RlmH, partial [Tissierellaceae bacterium]
MNIKLVTVGKIKEKYLKQAISEYSKRLSRYTKLEIIELSDEQAPENLSDKEIELIKNKEGERILSKIKDNEYVISLVIKGTNYSSEELADKIEDLGIEGYSNITFIIGGSLGLSDDVIKRSNLKLSFSKMTFP